MHDAEGNACYKLHEWSAQQHLLINQNLHAGVIKAVLTLTWSSAASSFLLATSARNARGSLPPTGAYTHTNIHLKGAPTNHLQLTCTWQVKS